MNWQSNPVILPGIFHGQKSLVGYSPWYLKEVNMSELTKKKYGDVYICKYVEKKWTLWIAQSLMFCLFVCSFCGGPGI